MTIFLPSGPSKTELLADPDSQESRRKRSQEKKRRQQRSIKRGAEVQADKAAPSRQAKDGKSGSSQRKPRLKASPEAVAAASQELLAQKSDNAAS